MRCHRNVLASASDYFNTMFTCGLEESTSATVQLTIQSEILTSIVEYIYTGEIELTIDNVESLVKACDVLQLNNVKTACDGFMLNHVKQATCVGFYTFATLYRIDQLQQKAKQVMLSQFKTVAFNAEFKELSCSQLIHYIKDDDVVVENEDVVFESVLDWIRHDLDNRKSSLEAILEHVRLPYCTSSYLWHMKDTCDLLNPKCFEYLNEAIKFHTDPVHQHEISSSRTTPRNNFRMKSCLLVVGRQTKTAQQANPNYRRRHRGFNQFVEKSIEYSCQYYEEDTKLWNPLGSLLENVSDGGLYSVCYVNGGLLLTGGGNMGGAMNNCFLFDLATEREATVSQLTMARYQHRSVSLGDCVYVVGGMGLGGNALASVERLNLKQRQWVTMPNMSQAVCDPMVVTYGNKIIVFGGQNAHVDAVCCTQVFDTTRSQWSTLSDLPEVCHMCAAVTLNDFIYVVGGDNQTCLKYDPASDSWTSLSQPRHKHTDALAVVWRGCVLVTGSGATKPADKAHVIERYSPETDNWSDWDTTIGAKMVFRGMFNVDLYGL